MQAEATDLLPDSSRVHPETDQSMVRPDEGHVLAIRVARVVSLGAHRTTHSLPTANSISRTPLYILAPLCILYLLCIPTHAQYPNYACSFAMSLSWPFCWVRQAAGI
jgi:hypothetical protein